MLALSRVGRETYMVMIRSTERYGDRERDRGMFALQVSDLGY